MVVLLFSCSAAGIVRTSVIVTGVQVCSRIFMVWFITNSIRPVTIRAQHTPNCSFSLLCSQLNFLPWDFHPGILFPAYSLHLALSSIFNKDPEWRECNPIPGCVDDDRDYQIFLLHIQPAPPPAVLHQMGQVEMPRTCRGDELILSLPCRTLCLSMFGVTWRFHL